MNDVLKKILERQIFRAPKERRIIKGRRTRKEEEAFKLNEKAFLEKLTTESEQLSQVEKLVDGFPVKVDP